MLSLFRNQAAFHLRGRARQFSGVVTANSLASGSNVANPPPPNPSASSSSPTVTHSYFVPRNTKGNLPVYTDVRNAGGRYLVLIRNIEGNAAVCVSGVRYSYAFSWDFSIQALAKDLSRSLFEQDSDAASRLKIQINQSKHLIITGGRWKNEVLEWLKKEGF